MLLTFSQIISLTYLCAHIQDVGLYILGKGQKKDMKESTLKVSNKSANTVSINTNENGLSWTCTIKTC